MNEEEVLLLIAILSSLAFSGCIIKVKMDSSKPNGLPWDAYHGAPDPYIKVDGTSYRSKRCQDSYFCSFQIDKDCSILSIEVWDADFAKDDFAGSTFCKEGSVCTFDGGQLVVQ